MKKLTALLLLALVTIPFFSSCSKDDDAPTKSVLATIIPFWSNPYGFAIQLDNNETMYPSNMRVNYQPKEDATRAIIQFSELGETVTGFTYNVDIYGIAELETKEIKKVTSQDASLPADGIKVVGAYIGGGYLNIEFEVNIDPYNKEQGHVVELIDNQTNGEPLYTTHYPLELRFKRAHSIMGERGTTVSNIACFRIGTYDLSSLGCQGYEIKFIGLDKNGNNDPESRMESVKITPANN